MIITLCGSTRFEPYFHMWNEALSLAGHVVFGLASYPSTHGGNKNWYTADEKRILDEVHFKKIEASWAILILNIDGYIGESTRNEIGHARHLEKSVYSVEGPSLGWSASRLIDGPHRDAILARLREREAAARG